MYEEQLLRIFAPFYKSDMLIMIDLIFKKWKLSIGVFFNGTKMLIRTLLVLNLHSSYILSYFFCSSLACHFETLCTHASSFSVCYTTRSFIMMICRPVHHHWMINRPVWVNGNLAKLFVKTLICMWVIIGASDLALFPDLNNNLNVQLFHHKLHFY